MKKTICTLCFRAVFLCILLPFHGVALPEIPWPKIPSPGEPPYPTTASWPCDYSIGSSFQQSCSHIKITSHSNGTCTVSATCDAGDDGEYQSSYTWNKKKGNNYPVLENCNGKITFVPFGKNPCS